MTGSRPRFKFGPTLRLRRAWEFQRLRETGRRLARHGLVLNWRPREDASHSRLGVVTGRKLGSAVERSRVRRHLREAFRRLQPFIRPPSDIVLVARPSLRDLPGKVIQARVERLLREAGLLADAGR